ncbi:hypothetical protein [Paraburkholderia sp. BL27I4N3]|uniref:hypothetical protein n=1 Tax=Paraburkholderia sp. BL27I4N3 TaxID=1938805 RepID=UPI0015F2694E|nr:hypothetical protein [Paraburkholderia sp. BL27I4N3]
MQFSDVLVPTTRTNASQSVTVGDTTPVIAQSGLPIQMTSAGVIGALVVFKQSQIWQITGDPATSNLSENYITLTTGCIAPRSIVQGPFGVFFAGQDAPYILNFLGTLVPLSSRPGTDFRLTSRCRFRTPQNRRGFHQRNDRDDPVGRHRKPRNDRRRLRHGDIRLQYTSASGFSCGTTFALTSATLAQFASTTSAQLAGIIPDETGSGSLVFASSPALAGTPANNQAQNKQTDDIARILRLNPRQIRQLHDEISGEGLGFHEIMERAKDMFNL